MKSKIIFLAFAFLIVGAGCTRHPTSSTITLDASSHGATEPATGTIVTPTTENPPPFALETGIPQNPGPTSIPVASASPIPPPTVVPLPQPSPTPTIISVTVGDRHACALDTKNQVWCWGDNTHKELGNLTDPVSLPFSTTPQLVKLRVGDTLDKVTAIAAGSDFTCAIVESNQKVICWGGDSTHFLALGANISKSVKSNQYVQIYPQPGVSLTGVSQITAGKSHACALLNDSSVYCWGDGTLGSVGQTPAINYSAAIQVVFPPGIGLSVKKLSTLNNTTCAKAWMDIWNIMKFYTYCWGENKGQIPGLDPANSPQKTPLHISALDMQDEFQLLNNSDSTCQLQNSNLICKKGLPVVVIPTPFPSIDSAYLGSLLSCIMTKGVVQCWADETILGAKHKTPATAMPMTVGTAPASQVAVGNTSGCLIANGKVKCFGQNALGQLGIGTSSGAILTDPVDLVWK
ncbi:hypothetical protein WDW37_20230 [Bdellovibrionota bacterium FG-1]